MAADLVLAADPDMIERSADPAGFVVQACQRAKAWLQEALEYGEIEQVAEIKSQAEAVRVYTTQKAARQGRPARGHGDRPPCRAGDRGGNPPRPAQR
jgi:uncharacterized protein Smg (DUF494 family)